MLVVAALLFPIARPAQSEVTEASAVVTTEAAVVAAAVTTRPSLLNRLSSSRRRPSSPAVVSASISADGQTEVAETKAEYVNIKIRQL